MIPHLISISLVSISAIISSVYTDIESEWYKCADPNGIVPNYAFPYIWFFLYLILAYVTFKIFKLNHTQGMVYIIMILTLCSLWSIVYFHYHKPVISIGILVAIFVLTSALLYIAVFENVKIFEPYLLVPFIVWISYAIVLNYISANKDCNNLI